MGRHEETWKHYYLDEVNKETYFLFRSLGVVCSENYCLKILLFLQFLSLQNSSFWLITPGLYLLIMVTKVHCLNMPFSFASHSGVLSMCKWPRFSLGTGGPPCVHVVLASPPAAHRCCMWTHSCAATLIRVITRRYRIVLRNQGLFQESQMPWVIQPVQKKMLKRITFLTNISRFYLTCVEEHSRSSRK